MSQHLSDGQLEKFISRKMSPAELLEADDHLAGCSRCVQRMNAAQQRSLESLTNALISSDEFDHVTYEQMSGYVDGTLGVTDREIVELHMGVCHQCSVQMTELTTLRSALSQESGTDAEKVRPPSRKSFFSRPIFAFAAAAAAVAVVIVIAWFGIRNAGNKTSPGPAIVEESPPVPQQSPAASIPVPSPSIETPKTLIALNDGGRSIELDRSGKLSGLADPGLQDQYRLALSGRGIDIPADVARLKGSSGVLMGAGGDGVPFKLIGPVGRAVESARPTLKWQTLTGAEKYKVGIYDENFNEVAASPELRSTSWTPPELARGRIYQWQVTAFRGEEEIKSPARPAPEAKFKVIDRQRYSEIEKARRTNSHLLLGVAYANAGLLGDAAREFQKLLQENPGSEPVKRLLSRVRSE